MKKMVIGLFASIVFFAGCQTERDEGQGERATLKAGQVVTYDMAGWVAVPYSVPEVKKAPSLNYAVLNAYNVVPVSLQDWIAVNPKLFSKMSGVAVDAGNLPDDPRYYLEAKGKKIPKDKTGWVAVPDYQPQREKSSSGKTEMAHLRYNEIIPKDMHGWVAVESDVLAKMVEKYMTEQAQSTAKKSDAK